MVHYMFETEWVLTAPVERVFRLLSSPEEYSAWWPQIGRSRSLEVGGGEGDGARAAYSVRGLLGYTLDLEVRTIEAVFPTKLRIVVRGDLVGTGTCYLETRAGNTRAILHWYVATTKPWMNRLSPLLRPFLAWSYRRVMRDGCLAVAGSLGARVVSTSSRLVERPTPVPATAG